MNNLKNKTIALFFGGRSPEHEISINSAKTVYPLLNQLFFKVYLIYVNKQGNFFIVNCDSKLKIDSTYSIENNIKTRNEISFIANKGIYLNNIKLQLDLAFILIHGNEGEDGKLQGLLDIMNIKYTGANSTSSGICIYKELTRNILISNNINTIDTIVVDSKDKIPNLETIKKKLSNDLFIKSETTGSSIGINALVNPSFDEFFKAINYSFKYSKRVLIQPLLKDIKEVEVAILEKEDHTLIAAGPGLVIKKNMSDILSYDKKYGNVDSATINTEIIKDKKLIELLQNQAKQIFKYLNLSGYSRIDFFIYEDKIYLNEVNTIPGMTSKSHFPLLLEKENISLIDALAKISKVALKW